MSAPYNVSPPTLEQVGDKLIAHNGSWMCNSGSVGGYLFGLFSSGNHAGGAPSPPPRETWDAARSRLATFSGNTFDSPVVGTSYTAQVWAVTFSGAWSTESAWAEWSAAATSNPVTVQAVTPPVAQPNVPAAIAELENVALNELRQSSAMSSTYKTIHGTTSKYSPLWTHTHVDKADASVQRALAFLRGENP